MHLRRKLFLAAVSAAVLHAQTTPPPPDEAPTFTLDTKLVPLHVRVLDKNGKLATNFPQSAFKVFENNVEQPLKIFNREDVPVSMGIIIDNSGSMREKRPKVAAAALELDQAVEPAGRGIRRRFHYSSSISTM
jgi:Ca-activated chloride channel family protein